MEQTILKTEPSTGILLSPNEAEEYRKYKRARLILAVNEKIAKTAIETNETEGVTLVRAAELARKYSLAAVRVTPSRVKNAVALLGESGVKTDALIGGTGQTLAKVKAYEGKLAVRMGAEELTVLPDPSLISGEKFSELKKELKKIKRKAGKARVKLYTEEKDFQKLGRLVKFLEPLGVGLSYPYFLGAQRLKTEWKTACFLEVRDVQKTEDFKKMAEAGIDRILSSEVESVRGEMMKEAENASFAVPLQTTVEAVAETTETPEKAETPETQAPEGLKKAEEYRSLIEEDKTEEK